jgi:hypothetical protein
MWFIKPEWFSAIFLENAVNVASSIAPRTATLPAQIWQWMRSPKGKLEQGRKVTQELFRKLLAEELPNYVD